MQCNSHAYDQHILPHHHAQSQAYDQREILPRKTYDPVDLQPVDSRMPLPLSLLRSPQYLTRGLPVSGPPCLERSSARWQTSAQRKPRVYFYHTPTQCQDQLCAICDRPLISRNAVYLYCRALPHRQDHHRSTDTNLDTSSARVLGMQLSPQVPLSFQTEQEEIKQGRKRVPVCSTCAVWKPVETLEETISLITRMREYTLRKRKRV